AVSAEEFAAIAASTPLRRPCELDELGRLVVFLASDLARCITGQLVLAPRAPPAVHHGPTGPRRRRRAPRPQASRAGQMTVDVTGICPATLVPDPFGCGPDDLRRALDGVAAAGFADISLWSLHAAALAAGAVADAGLRVRAVEAVTRWTRGPGPKLVADASAVIDVAVATGASVIAACAFDQTIDRGAATEGLAALCE